MSAEAALLLILLLSVRETATVSFALIFGARHNVPTLLMVALYLAADVLNVLVVYRLTRFLISRPSIVSLRPVRFTVQLAERGGTYVQRGGFIGGLLLGYLVNLYLGAACLALMNIRQRSVFVGQIIGDMFYFAGVLVATLSIFQHTPMTILMIPVVLLAVTAISYALRLAVSSFVARTGRAGG